MVGGFGFHPELLEIQQQVIAALGSAGIAWFSDYASVDVEHGDHGIEVCGVRERAVAERVYALLLERFPDWPCHWMYVKDTGPDPGWKIVITRRSGEAPFMGPGLRWSDVVRIRRMTGDW